MRAYSELFLEDAMTNLADLFDYGANDVGMPLDELYDRFISSGIAHEYGKGNPCYVSGHSGSELMGIILHGTGLELSPIPHRKTESLSPEYWVGWIMAYYQWYAGWSFKYLKDNGLTATVVLDMYHPLHEADVSKFVEVASQHIERFRASRPSPIKMLRTRMGISQEECAARSGVSLRMIRAYEQKQQDISKAEVQTVLNLSKVLMCPVEALL